jgi:hypothetical protein
MRRLLLLPLLALAAGACDHGDPVACTPAPNELRASAAPVRLDLPGPAAVWVMVVDSVTGENLTAGASGFFVTGSMADSLRHFHDDRLTAAGPAGRYSVIVEHAGYSAWGVDDVRVRAGECALQTEVVTARLQRAELRD